MDELHFNEKNSEAYFYFSLTDFEEIIKEYGVQFCFEKMSPKVKKLLLEFFKTVDHSKRKDVCSLLKNSAS